MADDHPTEEMNDECLSIDMTSSNALTCYDALPHESIPAIISSAGGGFIVQLEVNDRESISVRFSELQLMMLFRAIRGALGV